LADKEYSLSRAETGPVIAVSLISALRLLGIFLMLPVFSVYAVRYPGASAASAGVAFGIYALIQSVMQLPLGWASDRWGRKPVLLGGLAIFAVGSVACALAADIFQLIIARIIQGGGAVSAVAFAALADVTRPAVRTQAYTIIGVAIGAAFVIGILAGPLLAARIGLDGLFYLLAGLALLALLLAAASFPRSRENQNKEGAMAVAPLLRDRALRSIFLAAFVLSLALNLFFFTYPLSWNDLGLDKAALWKVYLIIFSPSVLLVFPYVRWAERRNRFRAPLLLGWCSAAAGYMTYWLGAQHDLLLYLSGAAFFLGYSLYQPLLPAFLSKQVPASGRGSASGIYTFAGFAGSSLGGILGGALMEISPALPEFTGVLILMLWFFLGLPAPPDKQN
jgi:predicted MFS family arabinose efflux permease